MFTQIWKKYLPVIIILMKRSGGSDQVLDMNSTDFTRAAGGRKARFSFSNVQLNNGRISSLKNTPPLAMDLMLLLQENEQSRKIVRHQQFEFALNSDFQLTIKNNTAPAVTEPSDSEGGEVETKSK
jgi:hypothetical protein